MEKQKGDLRLDTLSHDFTDPEATGVVGSPISHAQCGNATPEDSTHPEYMGRSPKITFSILKGRAARQARRGRSLIIV